MESDNVNSPSHYCQSGVECIEIIEAIGADNRSKPYDFFLWASAFQYLWRVWHKGNALQDAKKAAFYLHKLIEQLES